ncbi:hypothetical protein NIES267_09820 [Calothrix parasitica NIES-267]|uniref:Uncharacterized protein n=1 Tax=Calothrix parasitica NIES-267 TaxID=1973488 RepID=A0A1Z4LJX0_9CYAN|nr:hypothetical protein NIES267_09820 [Calothrix parasitica NIES-267]
MQLSKLKVVSLITTTLIICPSFTLTQQAVAKQFNSEQTHTQLQVYTNPILAKNGLNKFIGKFIMKLIMKLITTHLWAPLLVIVICCILFASDEES